MGVGAKVELTFDPGDLGRVNVLDPRVGTYVRVPAVDQAYARGLSFWQNKVIRRYAQRQLDARTDIVALAQAKAEIRALVERDFNRKSTQGRKRHARFMEDYTTATTSEVASTEPVGSGNPESQDDAGERQTPPAGASPASKVPACPNAFTDDEILPVFEADLDLPHLAVAGAVTAKNTFRLEESQ
jgi:putative transposase